MSATLDAADVTRPEPSADPEPSTASQLAGLGALKRIARIQAAGPDEEEE